MRKNSLDYKTILNLYLAMPTHQRSVRKLHSELTHKYSEKIKSKTISIPCINTLWNWSSQYNWKQLALEQQEKINHKVNERIVNQHVNAQSKMDSIVNDLQETSYLALQKITTALKQDLMKPVENASELKSLVNSVTDAMKMYSLMTGGVSSSSETVSHNVSNKKQIREEIIQLMTSLSNDGIDINLDEDKEDKKKLN